MSDYFSEDPFDLRIIPIVENLWKELGIDDSQRILEINTLKDSIRTIYSDFTAKLMSRCQKIRTEIQKIQTKQRNLMRAYGITEADINEELPPIQQINLIQQLEESKKKFSSFQKVIADRVQKLENLVCIARDLFDSLGIPVEERGEFNELGEMDLTRKRIERFRVKIENLKKEKEKRNIEMNGIRKKIRGLLKDMSMTLTGEDNDIMKSNSFSLKAIEDLNDLKTRLENKKIQRTNDIAEMAVTIIHLWNLLNVDPKERNQFLSCHSSLGDDSYEGCKKEIEKLSLERDKKLPELIATHRKEVEEYWKILHIADESRPRFVPNGTNQNENNINEFNFLESEIIRLKNLAMLWNPIIKFIYQREDIINEYNIMLEASRNSQRLISRGKGCAQQRMREEKARRRYRISLPSIETKLYQELQNYKKKNGTDFEWDGKPYIDQLSHIKAQTLPRKPKSVHRRSKTPTKLKKACSGNLPCSFAFSVFNRCPSPDLY